MYRRDKTPGEIAGIIERFVYSRASGNALQCGLEWNDLLECGVTDPALNSIIKECEVINRQFLPESNLSEVSKLQREEDADQRLKAIASQLRAMEGQNAQ